MVIVGGAAVRKGQHVAVEAWLRSSASEQGKLLIVGGFVPAYRERIAPLLAHPRVEVLGHRTTSRTSCAERRVAAAEPGRGVRARMW